MPTIRPTKRLLMPLDARLRKMVEQVMDDQSELWGISNSDAIIRDILNSQLPTQDFPRRHAEAVYSGDSSILDDIASVLRANVTGSIGKVAHPDYKRLVEFGLRVIEQKDLTTALDTNHVEAHHFRSRFGDVVDCLEHILAEKGGATENYDLYRKVTYGKDLLAEADPDRFSRAPALSIIQYALSDFEQVGSWNSTCAYLADVFSILADVANRRGAGSYIPSADTAAQRAEWARLLESETADWDTP